MANQHNRMVLSGQLLGVEVWSCSIAYKREDIGEDNVIRDFDDLLAQAEHVVDLIGTWTDQTPMVALLGTGNRIEKVRWEYRDGATLVQAAEAIVTGHPVAQSGVTKPFQTSVVFSLLSGRPGRSYRGRIFWPALGATISGQTGRLSSPDTATSADAMAEFLKDSGRRGGGQPDVDPVIYSLKEDIVTPVTKVSVGNVLDVQRRRRDALIEGRSEAVIPS